MRYPEYPVALGIIRAVEGLTYDSSVHGQIEEVKKSARIKCVDDLLMSGSTWNVD
jgi:2-oxoglutarate ferredoxin oxidoreductase subunit beta